MKKAVLTLFFLLASGLALALPTPKEIDTAVRGGQLVQAESMLREVLREKPNSAKAHYELGQVLAYQGRRTEAREALETAQKLDPKLKFASDPLHFRNLLNRVDGAAAERSPLTGATAPTTPAPEPTMPMSWILIGVGVLLVAVWLVRRMALSRPPTSLAAVGGGAALGHSSPYTPGGAPTQQGGSGIGAAALGGLAGLAAGYGLSRALGHGDDGQATNGADKADGLAPIDDPDAGYGSFDAGSGDDWDSGDFGGDDNW